ncbi:Protein of unknown function DUF761, plant [Dillenia turbinata]|uniref:Avr9/Cf-9 rapidly elicited protein n=1 Tax=Dillenia turbinata TaxID=194707 RepID=A0AAN8UJ03_9MAGN
MEQNLPVIAKKILNLVRVAYYMVRKGISKRKIMLDLNLMIKRGKIAGSKAFHNLMSHHHHHTNASSSSSSDQHVPFKTPQHEYEFSCSNSPAFPFLLRKRKTHNFLSRAARAPPPTADDEAITATAVNMVMDMLDGDAARNVSDYVASNMASPYLPGLGRSPMVRPVRITDSPFPLRNMDEEETRQVNKAAEDFIKRFYNDLRRQNRINE